MDNINELFNLIDRVPKYLYNIGVGQLPHREAEHFKSRYPDINVVGLEPQSSQYIARKPDYPGELYPWALWHGACLKELNLTTDYGNSSLLQVEQKGNKALLTGEKELVSCIQLDVLDSAMGNPQDIFLWMDIEGSEQEALQGGREVIASGRIRWILLEIAVQFIRKGQPCLYNINDMLSKHGYKYKIVGGCDWLKDVLFYLDDV